MHARTIYLLKRLEMEVTTQMTKILSGYDVTPAQFTILNFVDDHPDDLSSAQLSRRFLMTPQAMNEVIAALQRKEMLDKYTDAHHRRILRINLTEKGKAALLASVAAIDDFEKAFFEELSTDELALFREMMYKVSKSNNDLAVAVK